MRIRSLLVLPAMVALLAGCTADLDADTAAELSLANTRAALENGAAASAFVGATGMVPVECYDVECPEPAPYDWQEEIDAIIGFLQDEIFIPANVESVDGGKVTYLVPAGLRCEGVETFPQEYAACMADVEQMPIRLVASSPAEGSIDLEVLVGEPRYPVVSFRLYEGELGVTLDLGALKDAVALMASLTGELVDAPATFEGVVDLALLTVGPKKATVKLGVLESIRVEDTELGLSLSVGATPAALAVTFDGNLEALTGAVSLGPVDLALPAEDVWPAPVACTYDPVTYEETCEVTRDPLTGMLEAHLAGLTASTTFTAAQEIIELVGLGLGNETSWVTYAGAPLFSIDLNADLGRTVDVTMVPSEEVGVVQDVTFAPGLVASVSFDTSTLAAEDPTLFDAWTQGETLTVAATGETPPTVRTLEWVDDGTQTVVRTFEVLTGSLAFSSASRGESVVVEAGMCGWSDLQSIGTHPMDGMYAAACQ